MHRWAKQASTENPECFFQIDVHNSEILEASHNGYCNQLLFKKKQTLENQFASFIREDSFYDSMSVRLVSKCLLA